MEGSNKKDLDDKILVTIYENNFPLSILGHRSKRYSTADVVFTCRPAPMCITCVLLFRIDMPTRKTRRFCLPTETSSTTTSPWSRSRTNSGVVSVPRKGWKYRSPPWPAFDQILYKVVNHHREYLPGAKPMCMLS